MKLYIGTKAVLARPMTRGDYNEYRGWTPPEGEDQAVDGFLVEYLDGGEANHPDHQNYISWSPAVVFADAYKASGMMGMGEALELLRDGKRVHRVGWNGRGMFIYLVPAAAYPAQRGAAKAWAGDDAMIPYSSYLAIKSVDGTVVPWLASQTDLLGQDWGLYEENEAPRAAE